MALKDKKHFVATSKPQVYASKIITHFKLDRFFEKVYGSKLDGARSNKADLIRFILDRESIAQNDVFMIGDRKHDVIGARSVGIPAIGVTWEYGSSRELKDAGADHIFDSPAELLLFLAQ